jgi:hypothetical protein
MRGNIPKPLNTAHNVLQALSAALETILNPPTSAHDEQHLLDLMRYLARKFPVMIRVNFYGWRYLLAPAFN